MYAVINTNFKVNIDTYLYAIRNINGINDNPVYYLSIEDALISIFSDVHNNTSAINYSLMIFRVSEDLEIHESDDNHLGLITIYFYYNKYATTFNDFLVENTKSPDQIIIACLNIHSNLLFISSNLIDVELLLHGIYLNLGRGNVLNIIADLLELKGYNFFLRIEKYNTACLNMGYHVMDNLIAGSESIFVEKCHIIYNETNGWQNKSISNCTFNAAEFLSKYDLFGIQEVNKRHEIGLFNTILSFNSNFKFLSSNYHDDASIATGYDEQVMGPGIQITNNMKLSSGNDDRAIQAVWFEKFRLLFINLHAPHKIDLKTKIERACYDINLLLKHKYVPDRVIICGDFNDGRGQLFIKSINAFNKEIKIPSRNTIPKTCCADNGYEFSGDYILDSKEHEDNVYFGMPKGYDRMKNLYSDHDPVVLIEE